MKIGISSEQLTGTLMKKDARFLSESSCRDGMTLDSSSREISPHAELGDKIAFPVALHLQLKVSSISIQLFAAHTGRLNFSNFLSIAASYPRPCLQLKCSQRRLETMLSGYGHTN